MDKQEIKQAFEGFIRLLESQTPPQPPADGGVKEEELSYNSGPGCVKMLEAKDDNDNGKDENGEKKKGKEVKRMEVKLLAEGWSKNGYYYSKEVAESLSRIINSQGRRKMYIDHQEMFFSTPSRKLKEFAAVIVETYAKDGASYAIVESTGNPMTDWIFDFAERHPKEIGASIDARAKVSEVDEPEDDEDKKRNKDRWIVQELTFVNSVDFVSYASAGGEVVSALAQEALQIMESYVKQNQELISTYSTKIESGDESGQSNAKEEETKSSNHKPETNKEESTMGTDQITLESLKAKHPGILDSLREEITKEVQAAFNADKETKDLKAKVTSLEGQVNTLESERDGLKQKVDEFEVKEAVSKRRKRIAELIQEHELPEQAVTETFKKDLEKFEKEEDIIERIKDRKDLIADTSGEVTGNGQRSTKESDESKAGPELTDDALVEGIKS